MISSLSLRAAFAASLFFVVGSGVRAQEIEADPQAAREKLYLRLQLEGQREFVAVPGEREFSGRMIVRPLQKADLVAAGLGSAAATVRDIAMREIARFGQTEHVDATDEYLVDVPAGTEQLVARRLMQSMAFQYAEPDWTLYPIGTPNDTFYNLQYPHTLMQSAQGWDIHTGGPSVTVAICDTGVLTTHEDLQLHRKEAYNAVDRVWESQGGNIGPVHPHGTQTTGCAAANGNNGLGVAGVGWNLSHRMMRVSNSSGGGASLSVLQHAARTAVENGDNVASVSYSGADTSSNLTTATYVKSIGGLVIWAAGNDGRNLTFGNRDNDDLIVVGATDSNDNLASFSAYGNFVDVVAPGVSVPTTSNSSNASYVYASGTSFSCPTVAGMAALIWSRNPSLTPNQVESVLKSSTDDLGSNGVDNTFGYGRINTLKSMQNAGGGGGTPPTAAFSGTPTSGTAPLTVSFTDASTGAPTAWSWNFGDGNGSSSQNPSHTYTSPGSYTVTLAATNSFGTDDEIKVGYITVNPAGSAPVAEFSGTPTSGTVPLTVSFTDLSSNAPTGWSWSFGDGGTSGAQNPSHTYTSPGSYTVTLTASNAFGSDGETKAGYINVSGGGGEQQISFDGFESGNFNGGTGWSGNWSASGDVRVRNRDAATGSYTVRMRRNTGLIRRTVDVSGVTDPKLLFAARVRSFEGSDSFSVRYSADGSNYTTLTTFVNGDDDNSYHNYEFNLPNGASSITVEFDANMSGRNDYVYIDDVEVRGVQ